MNPVGLIANAAAIGGDIYSAYSSAQSAKDANKANKDLSYEQMAFQERMSSTAHQRQVEDMRRAGLNPILSANSGASSPAGSMATMSPVPSVAAGSLNSAMDQLRFNNEFKVARANARRAEAEAGLSEEELSYARIDRDRYFGAKYGSVDTAGSAALSSLMRNRRSISSAFQKLRLPDMDMFRGSRGYITDAEMRSRGERGAKARREDRRRSSPEFNRYRGN